MSTVNPDIIIDECARAWQLNPGSITGDTRTRRVVEARWAAAYILHESGMTLDSIGICLGGRCHTTISHAVSTFSQQLESNPGLKSEIALIAKRCGTFIGAGSSPTGQRAEIFAKRVLTDALRDIETARASIMIALSRLGEHATTEDIGHD